MRSLRLSHALWGQQTPKHRVLKCFCFTPRGGAPNLLGSELLAETFRSPELQTLARCVVSSNLTASTSKCLLARCFQEPNSHLSWPHLTKRDPLRVAKPCRSPELDPPGSFAFLGGCSQGVLLGWERPPRFSRPALVKGRKNYPYRF